LRWPLGKITVFTEGEENYGEFLDTIKSQLNVKEIEFKPPKETELSVELDTEITRELEAEGYARELSRQIQDFRKKIGLNKKDKVKVLIFTDEELTEMLEDQKTFLKERTNSSSLDIKNENVTDNAEGKKSPKLGQLEETFKNKTDFKIKDKRGAIVIF
jgi:hypothetical protein